jgi:hypothetical protein
LNNNLIAERPKFYLGRPVFGGTEMKRVLICGAALCALSIGAPASAATLVANGSFEQGTFTGGPAGSQLVQPGDTAISNWTVSGAPATWYQDGNNLNQIALTPHTGSFGLNLGDGSVRFVTVSQTISLLPFQEYRLSYWVGNYSANNGPVSVIADVRDGTSNTIIFSETVTAPATNQPGTWQQYTFDFIPDGTSNTISFTEGANGPSYVGLDDVSVTATPIPSALPLFATGIGALGLLGWRRRRKATAAV